MSRKAMQLGMALMMAVSLIFTAAAAENAPETAFTVPEGLRTELGAPDLKVITEAPKTGELAGNADTLPFGTSISGALAMKAAASPVYDGLKAEAELIEINPERTAPVSVDMVTGMLTVRKNILNWVKENLKWSLLTRPVDITWTIPTSINRQRKAGPWCRAGKTEEAGLAYLF